MGKTVIILMLGFTTSFLMLANGKHRNTLESVSASSGHFVATSTQNAAASGAYMALNKLYFNESWRTGYSNLLLNGDTLNVTVADNGTDSTVAKGHVRILSSADYKGRLETIQADVFTSDLAAFAVWSMDSVRNVTTQDNGGTDDPSLQVEYASFMPEVNDAGMLATATTQGHYIPGAGHFHPIDTYPNGSFYFAGVVPNITYVEGDLHVQDGDQIYGIYLVKGDIILDENVVVHGVLYQPDAGGSVTNNDSNDSNVNGGIVARNYIDGDSAQIIVRHVPEYMSKFMDTYAPTEPSMRIVSWK